MNAWCPLARRVSGFPRLSGADRGNAPHRICARYTGGPRRARLIAIRGSCCTPRRCDRHGPGRLGVAAFVFMDGVPRRLIPDNLKTGVVKPDLYDPVINRAFGECAAHFGCLVDPAQARKPRVRKPSRGMSRMHGTRSSRDAPTASPAEPRCRPTRCIAALLAKRSARPAKTESRAYGDCHATAFLTLASGPERGRRGAEVRGALRTHWVDIHGVVEGPASPHESSDCRVSGAWVRRPMKRGGDAEPPGPGDQSVGRARRSAIRASAPGRPVARRNVGAVRFHDQAPIQARVRPVPAGPAGSQAFMRGQMGIRARHPHSHHRSDRVGDGRCRSRR